MESEKEMVERLIKEELPDGFCSDCIPMTFAAYREANRFAKQFDRAQFRKTYGHVKLANVDQGLKYLAKKYPDIEATDTRIPDGSYEYVALRTKSLILTASGVPRRGVLPRRAVFRDTLASGVNLSLFHETETDSEPERAYFHVILLHSVERELRFDAKRKRQRVIARTDRPAFIDLIVPTRDALDCITRLSLFDLYPSVVDEVRGINREDVQSERRIKRRKLGDGDTGTGGEAK